MTFNNRLFHSRSVVATLLFATCLTAQSFDEQVRMNQIQILATHNSYKQAIDPSLLSLLRQSSGEKIKGIEYHHLPMPQQLDMGLRGLEIDVVYDPEGGRYAHPKGIDLVREKGLPEGPAYDPEGVMKRPGFKVLHIPDIDFRSSVFTFQQALETLKSWSDKHPNHLPVFITMNAKSESINRPGFVKLLPFDAAAFDAWDAEIRKGLTGAKLITPDDVRGNYGTLEEAARSHAWPTLKKSRGKFLFILDETGEKLKTYVTGHPSLRGRVMFVNTDEGQPEAAFRIVNGATEQCEYIQYLVRSGYMVRTRADADTIEARKGDYSRWKSALISGAQVISTDYPTPDPELKTNYSVKLPGNGPGVWNTLLLPAQRPLPPLE